MKSTGRICLYILINTFSSLCAVLQVNAQCATSFTYTPISPILYAFTNTTANVGPSQTITWYVQGPGIVYVTDSLNPQFYFPVNGTYYVTLDISGCGYVIDTLYLAELTDSGACQAGLSYYPTYAQNYEFDDASTSTDSIINYVWHGITPDTFIQANGWYKNSELSLWDYNCRYPYFFVTHTITTIKGCQSTVVDTVNAYCATCHPDAQPCIIVQYDSLNRQLILSDTTVVGQVDHVYWRIETADNQFIYSTAQQPAFTNLSDSIVVICVEVYDTSRHCTASICDSVSAFISGIKKVNAIPKIEVFESYGQLQIRYADIDVKSVEVYDVTGREVLMNRISSSPTLIQLPTLAGGMYFARLITGDRSVVRKFFVR